MISSCKDIKTEDEFQKLNDLFFNTKKVGLEETARLVIWNKHAIINPKTFRRIFKI